MAKVLEEVLVIKISKIVKDSDVSTSILDDDQKVSIEDTIPSLLDEMINDKTVVVEIAES